MPAPANKLLQLQAPPLALYVHFPWCVRKCPYCDFNSHELKQELPEQAYVQALLAELEQHLPSIWGRPIRSIFMGGGTPSLFSASALDELLSQLRARLGFASTIEITLEANPGTFEQEKFRAYREIGINRLSIGIQSFAPAQLTKLGRIHDRDQAIAAVATAQQAGFDNINLDLMYALPGQSIAEALADIDLAIQLGPTHLSHYQLTIEPNTVFAQQPPTLPPDDSVVDMELACRAHLADAGYTQYEISAFAHSARQCAHNRNYWQFGDYLGLGAGAHSKLTYVAQQQITRHWNCKHPRDYLQQANTQQIMAGQRTLTTQDRIVEFMMNSLRLHEGFTAALFGERTGLEMAQVQPQLDMAMARGLLELREDHFRPTEPGRRFLNDLLGIFV